jgi:hypothetical protein
MRPPPEVEQYAIYVSYAKICANLCTIFEPSNHAVYLYVGEFCHERIAGRDEHCLVFIDTDIATTLHERQYRARMPATAERTIDIYPAVFFNGETIYTRL